MLIKNHIFILQTDHNKNNIRAVSSGLKRMQQQRIKPRVHHFMSVAFTVRLPGPRIIRRLIVHQRQ